MRAQDKEVMATIPSETSSFSGKFIGPERDNFSTSKSGELQAGVRPSRKPEFQSPKRMVPISIRRAMVAIVKEQYVAKACVLDAAADVFPRLRCPVPGRHRPHHHL